MKNRHKLALLMASLLLAWLGARAQTPLAATLAHAYGNGVDAHQVDLSSGAALTCDATQVRLVAVRRLHKGLTQISARCAQSPSLPIVAWVRSEELPHTPLPLTAASPSSVSTTPPTIRAGARARLELTREGMIITLPVICLASGRAGETIRVMDTTGRLRFRARIVSAQLLRGELE